MGMSCFEMPFVIGYNRVPDPPARMMPFIEVESSARPRNRTRIAVLIDAHACQPADTPAAFLRFGGLRAGENR